MYPTGEGRDATCRMACASGAFWVLWLRLGLGLGSAVRVCAGVCGFSSHEASFMAARVPVPCTSYARPTTNPSPPALSTVQRCPRERGGERERGGMPIGGQAPRRHALRLMGNPEKRSLEWHSWHEYWVAADSGSPCSGNEGLAFPYPAVTVGSETMWRLC